MISETKLHDSFLSRQFHIDGFGTPIRLGHNKNCGGIAFCTEKVPIEGIYVKLTLYKKMVSCSYNPKKN